MIMNAVQPASLPRPICQISVSGMLSSPTLTALPLPAATIPSSLTLVLPPTPYIIPRRNLPPSQAYPLDTLLHF